MSKGGSRRKVQKEGLEGRSPRGLTRPYGASVALPHCVCGEALTVGSSYSYLGLR